MKCRCPKLLEFAQQAIVGAGFSLPRPDSSGRSFGKCNFGEPKLDVLRQGVETVESVRPTSPYCQTNPIPKTKRTAPGRPRKTRCRNCRIRQADQPKLPNKTGMGGGRPPMMMKMCQRTCDPGRGRVVGSRAQLAKRGPEKPAQKRKDLSVQRTVFSEEPKSQNETDNPLAAHANQGVEPVEPARPTSPNCQTNPIPKRNGTAPACHRETSCQTNPISPNPFPLNTQPTQLPPPPMPPLILLMSNPSCIYQTSTLHSPL